MPTGNYSGTSQPQGSTQVHLSVAGDCPNHSKITSTHHSKDEVKNTKHEAVWYQQFCSIEGF